MNKKVKTLLSIFLCLSLLACDNQAKHSSHSKFKAGALIRTVTGEKIDLNKLNRQWLIVNYWANWCEPCKKEIPELNALAKSHHDLYLVGVNYDGVNDSSLLELIAKNKIEYFNALNDPTEQLGVGDIPGLPVTFVFNQKGELQKTLYGPQTKQSLEKVIQ